MKRIISIMLLCALVAMMLPVQVFAQESLQMDAAKEVKLDVSKGVEIVDTSSVVPATSAEANSALIYQLVIPESWENVNIVDKILESCTILKSETVDGMNLSEYSTGNVSQYLYNCGSVVGVSMIDEYLYINYNTTDGKYVVMSYLPSGLYCLSMYDNATDTAVSVADSGNLKYENFRYGSSFTMSEALLNEINELAAEGDFDTIKETDGLTVYEDADGNVVIEPDLEYIKTGEKKVSVSLMANGFSSETQLLSNLKSNFPMYTNKSIAYASKYSSSLRKNVSVRVTETRNNYIKKTADWDSWAIGTSLATIGLFLPGLTSTMVAAIITALGVTISTIQTIQQAATLYRSAKYSFSADRWGVVYDTTVHNAYVGVIRHRGTGELAGGYDGSDTFRWIISEIPTSYNKDTTVTMTSAISTYDACIAQYGECFLYDPITITY